MADLGLITIYLALALSGYSAIGGIMGRLRKIPSLVESARYATYMVVVVLALSVGRLVWAFLSNDFQLAYVAQHSSLAMPQIYTWVAFYTHTTWAVMRAVTEES